MSGYRAIAAFPFVCVVVAVAVLVGAPADARPTILVVDAEIVKVLALVGLAAAASAFERGEYLRRGWGLSALCYALLLARDAWLAAAPGQGPPLVEIGRALLVAVANASMVLGTWTLARAWRVAGLEFTAPSALSRSLIGLAVVAALVFAGPSLAVDLHDAALGQRNAWWAAASDLGDLLALPTLAPVALTALSVRDGTLRWPWALLSGSLLAWLLYDAALTVPDLLHVAPTPYRYLGECFRIVAGTCACAAGLAQRRAVRDDDA